MMEGWQWMLTLMVSMVCSTIMMGLLSPSEPSSAVPVAPKVLSTNEKVDAYLKACSDRFVQGYTELDDCVKMMPHYVEGVTHEEAPTANKDHHNNNGDQN